MEIGSTCRIFCNTCKVTTNHELKAFHNRSQFDSESYGETSSETPQTEWQYLFLTCRGCDTATLFEEYLSHIEDIEDVREIYYHPEREKTILPIKIFRELDPKLKKIYQEVITTFNHDARILSAIGLRALLEGICADKGVEGNNLYKKIDGLKAHLPENIVESLHKFRFMGNEAAHELQPTSENELRLAIEVIEDLLNFLYELDYKARSLFEGGIVDPSTVRPNIKVIRKMIERPPTIPKGQIQLYQALYQAGSSGLEMTEIAEKIGRTKGELYGVLGALGRRINNTPGVQGKPGVAYVLKFTNFDRGDGFGWAMRSELKEALESGNYEWAKTWAK